MENTLAASESKASESKENVHDDGLETIVAHETPLPTESWESPGACWQSIFDPAIGVVYYYNRLTGESRWEPPECYTELTAPKPGPAVATGTAAAANPRRASAVRKHHKPFTTLFVLARSWIEAKKALVGRKNEIVEQIRVSHTFTSEVARRAPQLDPVCGPFCVQIEFVQFERAQQDELRKEIAKLEVLLLYRSSTVLYGVHDKHDVPLAGANQC